MTTGPKNAWRLLILIVLISLIVVLFSRREPSYQGKSLSEWAQQYGSNHWGAMNSAADKEPEFAIRQVGTNGIPFLLDLMRTRESVLKKKLRMLVPQRWHDKLRTFDESGRVRRIGAHGLAALGTNAPAAIPELIQLAKHHPDDDGRYIAVFAIRTLGSAAEPAIPFLIECLTNKINIIRDDAALGLGYIGLRPDIVVRALIRYLEFAKTTTSTFEPRDAIQSLAQFRAEANGAVPVMLSLLNHSSSDVREAVTNWLPRIDAEAARKAGVKPQ